MKLRHILYTFSFFTSKQDNYQNRKILMKKDIWTFATKSDLWLFKNMLPQFAN